MFWSGKVFRRIGRESTRPKRLIRKPTTHNTPTDGDVVASIMFQRKRLLHTPRLVSPIFDAALLNISLFLTILQHLTLSFYFNLLTLMIHLLQKSKFIS